MISHEIPDDDPDPAWVRVSLSWPAFTRRRPRERTAAVLADATTHLEHR